MSRQTSPTAAKKVGPRVAARETRPLRAPRHERDLTVPRLPAASGDGVVHAPRDLTLPHRSLRSTTDAVDRVTPEGLASNAGASRPRLRSGSRGLRELAWFGALYLVYDGDRWVFAGRPDVARANAASVTHFERLLHIAIEGSVQQSLSGSAVSWFLANVYLAAQLAVLPGSLFYLYRRAPSIYRALRNTVVAVWAASIPIFAAYPVAPPRLAGIGLKDTVSHQAAVALTGHSTLFYNPYAAMPSLHVGFAFAISVALAAAAKHSLTKALTLLWGPLVTLAVIATGNHYVLAWIRQ